MNIFLLLPIKVFLIKKKKKHIHNEKILMKFFVCLNSLRALVQANHLWTGFSAKIIRHRHWNYNQWKLMWTRQKETHTLSAFGRITDIGNSQATQSHCSNTQSRCDTIKNIQNLCIVDYWVTKLTMLIVVRVERTHVDKPISWVA